MKINGENVPVNANPTIISQRIGNAESAEKSPLTPQNERTDRIVISDAAKKVAELMAAVSAIQDVREDRISEIRKRMESGDYRPDADKIAGKILGEL